MPSDTPPRREQGGPRTTLAQVAAAAGCSVSTASRVLAGRGEVRPALRQRVRDAARDLGYDRQLESRGRRPGHRADVVDLVLPQFDSPWAHAIIAGAQSSAFARGFDLVLTPERDDPGADWLDRILRRGSSGVVVALTRPTRWQFDALAAARIPLALIDPRSDPASATPIVSTGDWQGGFDAGAHLGSMMRTRTIALAGVPRWQWGRARVDGVRSGVASVNPSSTFEIVDVDWATRDVETALRPRLERLTEPVALFASNDEMAFSTYDVAAELGLRIPDDLAVMGFDDEPEARHRTPPLSTMRQPLRAIAAVAIAIVTEEARGRPRGGQRFEVPSELVVRGSTGSGRPPVR